MDRMHYALF